MTTLPGRPKVILFDIGGVVVKSPFQAILDYERAHAIPTGYINHAISASAPNGSWQRLERGEIPLDDDFFAAFREDLCKVDVWERYYRKSRALRRGNSKTSKGGIGAAEGEQGQGMSKAQKEHVGYEIADAGDAAADTSSQSPPPPPPQIDTKALFWNMMRISRTPDPHIYRLLLRLRELAEATTNLATKQPSLILAALSNTVAFPRGIRDETGTVFEPGLNLSPFPQSSLSTSAKSFPSKPLPQLLSDYFSVFISSAHVGLRKPDPAIYALAVRELDDYVRKWNRNGPGIVPADILFLDDIGQNLRAARELGMKTLKVELGKTEQAANTVAEMWGLKGREVKL